MKYSQKLIDKMKDWYFQVEGRVIDDDEAKRHQAAICIKQVLTSSIQYPAEWFGSLRSLTTPPFDSLRSQCLEPAERLRAQPRVE